MRKNFFITFPFMVILACGCAFTPRPEITREVDIDRLITTTYFTVVVAENSYDLWSMKNEDISEDERARKLERIQTLRARLKDLMILRSQLDQENEDLELPLEE